MSHMHISRQYLSGTTVIGHSQAKKAARSTNPCLSVRAVLILSARRVLRRGTLIKAYMSSMLLWLSSIAVHDMHIEPEPDPWLLHSMI